MPVPDYSKDVPIGAKPKRGRKKRNTSSLLRQTDGPLLDQDNDKAEDDYDTYDAEADFYDTHVPTIAVYSTQLEGPRAYLFESEVPEPDESGLNEFGSPITTPARVTPFRNTAQ